jgi:hypothetical protein
MRTRNKGGTAAAGIGQKETPAIPSQIKCGGQSAGPAPTIRQSTFSASASAMGNRQEQPHGNAYARGKCRYFKVAR